MICERAKMQQNMPWIAKNTVFSCPQGLRRSPRFTKGRRLCRKSRKDGAASHGAFSAKIPGGLQPMVRNTVFSL